MSLVFCRILIVKGIALGDILRFQIAFLIVDGDVAMELVKFVQRLDFELMLMFLSRYVTKGNKNGIAGMVVNVIEGLKLFVTQVRN